MADIETGNMVVRVSKNEFRGNEYIDIRKYYQADDGEWRPTKKGISLSLDVVERVFEEAKKLI